MNLFAYSSVNTTLFSLLQLYKSKIWGMSTLQLCCSPSALPWLILFCLSLQAFPELFSCVLLPYYSPPRCPFPVKSLALSAHVSPRTIHFQVLDKSRISGPGKGPPSCNKWQLWQGLFFVAADTPTTQDTQGPACLPMDQTQRPQLGPFCPWSPPDADNWLECPDQVRNKRLY